MKKERFVSFGNLRVINRAQGEYEKEYEKRRRKRVQQYCSRLEMHYVALHYVISFVMMSSDVTR